MSRATSLLDRTPSIEPGSRAEWRRWLADHHATATGIWVVWPRKTALRGLDYGAAVEEALCFGWIDGQAAGVDELRMKQYFAPRRPRSRFSRPNLERYERMLAAGLVTPAGAAAFEKAAPPTA